MSEIENLQDDDKTKKSPTVPLMVFAAPFRIIGSLTVGLILIAIILFLLACGTFIESEYGSAVARFVLYGSSSFFLLIGLLAINILANIVSRFPWGRYGIPFLTVHVGILILLYGCFKTWSSGEEAQITLPEGTISRIAVQPERQQFELKYLVHPFVGVPKPLNIPFSPGPFSWNDYLYANWIKNNKRYQTILWYAMQFVHRDQGKLNTGDPNVELEILDYYAGSALEPVPPLDINVLWKKGIRTVTELGEVKEVPRNWEQIRLELRPPMPGLIDVRGANVTMSQGERVSYSFAAAKEELAAFQTNRPKRENAGLWGEVVLFYGGNHYSVNVDQLLNIADGKRVAVSDSDLTIGDVRFRDRGPLISFTVSTPSGEKEMMTLFPDNHEMNVQARRIGVFGSYWVDPQKIMKQSVAHADSPTLQRLALPRLDFMQGPNKKLYYRFWSGSEIIEDGVVPDREEQKNQRFKIAEGLPSEADVVIERFVGQDVPGCRIVPLPVGRDRNEQRVKLRVVFDGNEDTFWLRAVTPTVVPLSPESDQIRYVYGKERTLCVQLNFENLDLGFGIFLKKFEQRTEPGTRMPSHFSSLVDYVEAIEPTDQEITFSRDPQKFKPLPNGENVLISMNRPGYFRGTGRDFRIYQSSYLGPFYPDQPQFHELYDGSIFPWEERPREAISMSTLSVNSDPGRGWKYAGCFLLVLGTALFIRRRR